MCVMPAVQASITCACTEFEMCFFSATVLLATMSVFLCMQEGVRACVRACACL